MELEQREGTMAAVGFEEFSAPPGSELALPPLFGATSWRASWRRKWSLCQGVWVAQGSGSEMKRKRQPGAGGGASGIKSQKVPGTRSALPGDRAGERAGPEQAPSGAEDNSEAAAGAEVPHESAGLLWG